MGFLHDLKNINLNFFQNMVLFINLLYLIDFIVKNFIFLNYPLK
jgi:hypothetical protein